MAALSLHSVQAQAKEDVSEHMRLQYDRAAGTYTWVYSDGKVYNSHVVSAAAKVRDLKMAQWMDEARILLKSVEAGETKEKPRKVDPAERPAEPMPGFMIVGKGSPPPKAFDPNPETQGYNDAQRGITACPYSLQDAVGKWNTGHDRACDEDNTLTRRFGFKGRSRN